MSHGLPLLVSDRGGPGYMVDGTCGIKVPPRTPEQYARDLASAVTRMVTDRGLRARLGEGARRKAASIGLWDKKTDRLGEIYAEIVTAASQGPHSSPVRPRSVAPASPLSAPAVPRR
jgi:glycosyltransferase involved in cell wall biosynthesis